ncbi:MAG: bifunctional 3-deoxy-7-phosphoheptulonate synthase/chorismate mutase type II [Bacteroidales bacterium]|nr:bifunctional 3-deoxy-7-phosphoheptulonate synthase/chorismate mutase type II [Bacteroidales bacterium]
MFQLIAGPCAAESKEQLLTIAKQVSSIGGISYFRCGIWKPRTRPNLFEGVGEKGLSWLKEVKEETLLKTLVEVATPLHVEKALSFGVDALWIGARTTTSPFYTEEIARSLKGVDIPVFIKNPLNPDIKLWIGAIERFNNSIKNDNSKNIFAIHRGFSLADNGKYRQSPYWKIPIELKRIFPYLPIICDPSHICGNREYIKEVCQSALNIGMDGLMIEVHNNPEKALTDSKQQITPLQLKNLIEELIFVKQQSLQNSSILSLRKEIDDMDFQIMDILKRRMDISLSIAKIKKEENISILQVDRFSNMLKTRLEFLGESSPISSEFIKDLFELIHQESIRIQNEKMKE